MRTIVCGCLVLFAHSLHAQERWVLSASDNKTTILVDSSRITRTTEGLFRGFSQMVLTGEEYWNGDRQKAYQKRIDLVEFNCKDMTYRSLTAIAYNRKGLLVGS